MERTRLHLSAGKTLPYYCSKHIYSIEHLRILSHSWYGMQHDGNTALHSACAVLAILQPWRKNEQLNVLLLHVYEV